MILRKNFYKIFLLIALTVANLPVYASLPILIAHRGASGYLPEHTAQAKAMAYAMGSDYLEQDVVLTKDEVPIMVHDIYLDTVTDVAEKFPGRARKDGRFYAIDFTLKEIKSLNVNERINIHTHKAVFPDRFPLHKSVFKISTLAEEIELILGLNKSTGKNVGLYTEIKKPAWHKKQGKDITLITLKLLADYGYKSKNDKIFIQCFDANELKRIKFKLHSKLKLILLLEPGEKVDFKNVSEYAAGVGPSILQLIKSVNSDGEIIGTNFVKQAHKYGLKVHPWTLRKDMLPNKVENVWILLNFLFNNQHIDGIFSDFPDIVNEFKASQDLEDNG